MVWPNNLPHQLTTFIGREHELDEVLALLNKGRLVTLTGAGGSGKTRLALQAADLTRGIFPDGAWLVELASISDSRLVPQAVAGALSVREDTDKSLLDTLIQYLQPLKLLLVLDNCEHLVGAAASLARTLLRACPDLTILATSRQGLNIEGELCWRVPSLSLPNPHAHLSPDELRRYEAVQLFVERAKQRRSDFALTPDNAEAVSQLCYRLDGIPLALELAAARTKVLSVDQIVQRLDERFRLLSAPNQGALPRHQTLEAMIDWSYDILSAPERTLFRALSVFAGGFALEALVPVLGAEVDEFSALELLSQLVDKSLVMFDEHSNQARYRLLDTLRQYAWQKATEAGEVASLHRRHLAWCVTLAEGTEDALVSRDQAQWLERLDEEHDNLRVALAYAASMHDDESEAQIAHRAWMALRLSGALVWYWYFRGYLSEGRVWLESALAIAKHPAHDVPLATALSAAGVLAWLQGDYAAARKRLEESLTIWHELNDKRGTAFALTFFGRLLAIDGDPLRRELGERSVELFREIGDQWGLALSLDFLGEEARDAGNADLANALHEESLSLYRALGHHWGIALELSHFARVSASIGDYAEARRRLEEAVVIQRAVGDRSMLAWSLNSLGDILVHMGEIEGAESLYRGSLDLFREVEHRGGTADSLHKWGTIALGKHDLDTAWALTGESLDINRNLNYRQGVVGNLLQLGHIAKGREDLVLARSLYREALTLARTLGDQTLVCLCVRGLAALAAVQEKWDHAALLLGVANRAEQLAGEALDSTPDQGLVNLTAALRRQLGERAFDTEYRRGMELPEAEGISAALHDDKAMGLTGPNRPITSQIGRDSFTGDDEHEPLTRREVEVLKLIAEGLTDAQIADRLVLSTRTVQAHVRSIYSKLEITTRSAATRYAIKHEVF